MRLRTALIALLTMLAVAGGIACSAGSSSDSSSGASTASGGSAGQAKVNYPAPIPADKQVTISFTNYNVASAGLGKEATEQMVNEFMQQHPNIKVTFRPVNSPDITAKTQAEVVAGDPPDLAQLVFSDLDFIVNGLRAKPIDSIVPPDEFQAYSQGLHPRGLKLAELNGKMYGVPYVFSTPNLFYNADLFKAAGLDPEKPPQTWAEVKQAALQIKERTGKAGVNVACLGTYDWCFQGIVRSNGGRVLSEDRTKLTFDEPDSIAAIAMWQDLVKSGAHPTFSAAEAQEAFMAGNVGMYLQTSALQAAILRAAQGKWELRAGGMPSFSGKPVRPTNSGSGVFILANDPVKQRAAWELAKFLTSERGYTIITSQIGYLPLRPAIVNDPNYLKSWADTHPLIQSNLKQLDDLEPWVSFPGPNYVQMRDIMMKAVENVVYNGADPQKTMTEARTRAADLMPKR
jgi:multiple sugar transport system substrate-binding protein